MSSEKRELYFDNAATSYPKPEGVEMGILHFHRHLGASAGRGSYPRAVLTGRLLGSVNSQFGVRRTACVSTFLPTVTLAVPTIWPWALMA